MLTTLFAKYTRPVRLASTLALLGSALALSGYSSCAGATGPLAVPLFITPKEVLLRASSNDGLRAVGLARVDGGETGDRYTATVTYFKSPPTSWLTVIVSGRNLTLQANPAGLDPATYIGTVTIEGPTSEGTATLRVEFTVTR